MLVSLHESAGVDVQDHLPFRPVLRCGAETVKTVPVRPEEDAGIDGSQEVFERGAGFELLRQELHRLLVSDHGRGQSWRDQPS